MTFRWLIHFLSQRGENLSAGQVFITGSFASVLDVPQNCPLRFRFGALGVLSVQFRAT
jgi:2-keto-4-pentenoate hydratase